MGLGRGSGAVIPSQRRWFASQYNARRIDWVKSRSNSSFVPFVFFVVNESAKMNREQMLEDRVAMLERQLAMGSTMRRARSVRKTSERTVLGMPLYDIAVGPNFETGEIRGHARGFIAVGDIATGVLAMGGVARGVVAFGGVAIGAFSFGGLSIGVIAAIGGAAIGGVALGGAAIGLVAIGGGALGYYAVGGGAFGEHVINGVQRDPAAVAFFENAFEFLKRPLGR